MQLRRLLVLLAVVLGVGAALPLVAALVTAFALSAPDGAQPAAPGPTAKGPPAEPVVLAAATGFSALAFSPHGLLIMGDTQGRVRLRPERLADDVAWTAHESIIRRVWPLAGTDVATASADGSVAFWSVGGHPRARLRLKEAHLNDAVQRASDGFVFVAADGGTVARLCDPTPCWRLAGTHGAAAYALALSPDGETLASGGMDGDIALRDPATGVERARFAGAGGWVTALLWTSDGLFVGDQGGRITRWTAPQTDARPQVVETLQGAVTQLAPHQAPGGPSILAGAEGGALVAIDRPSRDVRARIETGRPVRALASRADLVYVGDGLGPLRAFSLRGDRFHALQFDGLGHPGR